MTTEPDKPRIERLLLLAAVPAIARSGKTLFSEEELTDGCLEDLTNQKDLAYAERDLCVAALAALALKLGWRAGLGKHDPCDVLWDADWRNVVFIDLPGSLQVSWHIHDSELPDFAFLPPYPGEWDGHTTAEKYARLKTLMP